MFVWNEQSRQWYINAARLNPCHQEQARLCKPFLTGMRSVAEFGCGHGFLAMEIASLGLSVTALDVDEDCLAFARMEARARNLTTVRFLKANALALDPTARWDCVLCCLFGDFERDLDIFLSHAQKQLLILTRRAEDTSLVPPLRMDAQKLQTQEPEPGSRRRQNAGIVEELLQARQCVYKRLDCSFEFGQPFADMEEARAFVRHYAKGSPSAETVDSFLEARLVSRPFGLYLPHEKKMSLFAVETTA